MNKKMLGRIALSIIVPVTVVIIWTTCEEKKPITYSDSGKVAIGTTAPMRYIFIQSPSGNDFYFDVSADTLKVGGTLSPDSAAQIFINYCAERYSGRIEELQDEIVVLKRGESSAFTSYADTNYVITFAGDSIYVKTDLPMSEAAELFFKRLRELNRSQFAIGDSVAIMVYDSGHWAGNYAGRIVERNWTTDRYLVRSWSLYSRKFNYQWIDAASLEKMP